MPELYAANAASESDSYQWARRWPRLWVRCRTAVSQSRALFV